MFLCQQNSYIKELTTKVSRCEKSVLRVNGRSVDGYNVILEDTILFPEGGGQPDDRGTIGGKPVLRVQKVSGEAVHFVECESPFDSGADVDVKVDWKRRWDHMQQHTAQHLISAVAEDVFKLLTTSWTLGEEVSTIEVDSPAVDDDVVSQLETVVNDKIKNNLSVEVKLFDKSSPDLVKVRSRFELPEDADCIRVINIDGVDLNTCCGTHVSTLVHLQAIKLLFIEKGKKNKSNLVFIAGDRLLRYLDNCVKREKTLTALLKNGPEEHCSLVDKLQKSLKIQQKNCLNAVRDIALLEANNFKNLQPKPAFYSLHRSEGLNDFASIFLNEVSDFIANTLFVLTVANDASPNSGGYLALAAEDGLLQRCVDVAKEMLNAKGVIKQGRFQAKIMCLTNRSKFEDRIKMLIKAQQQGGDSNVNGV